jgi:tetratricopeptide (TPR) repeat protein
VHRDEQAVRTFAALFQVGSDSAAAHLLTAGMMLRAKLPPGAATEAGRALEIDPHIPQAHFILGEAALSRGDDGKAVEEFQHEIASNPSFFMAYYRLGAAYENRGAWDDAISALQRAIWLNPNHSGPYALIGKAYLKRGNLDDAAGALRHALQMDPQDQAIRQLLDQTLSRDGQGAVAPAPSPPIVGRSEYLAGHIQEAIPLLEKARAAGARNNDLFFMLGNSYLQAHRVPKGRAAFADLYGVPAESAAARLFTAHMLMRLEFEDDAQAELEGALAREPKLPEAHFMLGEIAIYRAQLDRAADELGREIALNPGFAMAYYRLGDACTRHEDWEHAVPPLQRAVWLDPTYSGPYILLGKTYLKKGDLAEAERMLRRALQMDPKNASAHYLLGRTLIQSGHAEEGKKLLQRWEELRQESGQ